MRVISENTFLGNPMRFINLSSYEEDFTTVRHDDGHASVIISEQEWTMLQTALSLCMEHPEWTKAD